MKSTAPSYDWICLCCERTNIAGCSVCIHCGLPVGQSAKAIETARAAWLNRQAKADGVVVPEPRRGRFDDLVVNYKLIFYSVCAAAFATAAVSVGVFFMLFLGAVGRSTGGGSSYQDIDNAIEKTAIFFAVSCVVGVVSLVAAWIAPKRPHTSH
jgi:hypothetical protein